MYLTETDLVSYLANIVLLANADGDIAPKVVAALEEIRTRIGAKKSTYDGATKLALSGTYSPVKIGGFSEQVSNLADMLYVAILDGNLSEAKKKIIAQFSDGINLSEEQRTTLSHDAINRLKAKEPSYACPLCSAKISEDAKYCPKCGADLTAGSPESEVTIPKDGYAIEFSESTSGSFPSALKLARSAPRFVTYLKNKKSWYLAAWPLNAIENAAQLAGALSGIRNKRCYREGIEVDWDDLFGFLWCAEERNKAYRPTEYCFGKAENVLNPWGCKQARLDWTEWARWFSYGKFEKQGIFRGSTIWTFDKARIRHELLTNLHKFRFCPHLRLALIDAVLRRFPDRVEVTDKGAWKYSHSYQEVPGSIKIVEVERSGGVEFKQEYFADGVRPRDLTILSALLKASFADAHVTDIQYEEIVR
jgi:zinc-ribbon domain